MWLELRLTGIPHLYKKGKGEVPCFNKRNCRNNGTKQTRSLSKQQ